MKDNNNKKFKLGRNTGTHLLVFGSLLLIIIIAYIIIALIDFNKASITPFVDGDNIPDNINEVDVADNEKKYTLNVNRVNKNEFNLFDVDLHANSYNTSNNKIEFEIGIKWNDNTTEMTKQSHNKLNILSGTTYTVFAYMCLGGYTAEATKYSSKLQYNINNEQTTYTLRTSTLSMESYPLQKGSLWPFIEKLESPDAYLLLYFTYDVEGITKYNTYIIKYTYDDYHTSSTIGGKTR